jgi:exo-1,4-beta-D-glucosaminidase
MRASVVLALVCCTLLSSASVVQLKKWRLTSSANITVPLAATSLRTFDDSAWVAVTSFKSVLGALIDDNGEYPDVFKGLTLSQIPGGRFAVPWVYRTLFTSNAVRGTVRLKGLSYRGEVFLNGKLQTPVPLLGSFAYHDVTLSGLLVGTNAMSVVVWRAWDDVFAEPKGTDLSITWVDWNPTPADGSMGLWREVELYTSQLLLDGPVLDTRVSADLSSATVVIGVTVQNLAEETVSGATLTATLLGQTVNVSLALLQPGETVFASFPVLSFKSPALWWPWQMGAPSRHQLTISAGPLADTVTKLVGLREIGDHITAAGYKLYTVNHVPLLPVRSGGYSMELFLRESDDRVKMNVRYAKDLGLNAIRLEGQLTSDVLFDEADRMGMFITPGISCCDGWQHWDNWTDATLAIATHTLQSQVRRIRSHPSALAFWYSSDMMPPAWVESAYLSVFKNEAWPNGLLNSCSNLTSNLTGVSGVKMSGPYAYVPPVYWMQSTPFYPFSTDDNELGGAYAFLSEGGPGAAPMLWESMVENVANLWPLGDDQTYHTACGTADFCKWKLEFFVPPLAKRYGELQGARDFSVKSQAQAYETYRAMFEAYNRNKNAEGFFQSTGVVAWMMNNARPQHYWHLYEYNGLLGGSFFGSKKANEPLHLMMSPLDYSVTLYNSLYSAVANVTCVATMYDVMGSTVLFQRQTSVSLDANGAVTLPALQIPRSVNPSELRFVELVANGARNVYWIPDEKHQDVIDWNNSTWYTSYCSSFADYTALGALPMPTLAKNTHVSCSAQHDCSARISVTNKGPHVAFFVRVRLVSSKSGGDVTPASWSDNFVTLFPGQQQVIQVDFHSAETQFDSILEPFSLYANKQDK